MFCSDDIVLLADSREELQMMLDELAEFSRQWRFSVNVEKSAVMVIRPPSERAPDEEVSFRYGDEAMKVVDEFKYLGVVLDEKFNWRRDIKKRVTKSKAAMARLQRTVFKRKWLGVDAKAVVWKVMVASVLAYGQEVMTLNTKQQASLESAQLSAARWILHSGKRAANEGVRGELGWMELQRAGDAAKLRFWAKLQGLGEHRWPRKVHDLEWERHTVSRTWRRAAELLIAKYGLEEPAEQVRSGELSRKKWKAKVDEAVRSVAVEAWKEGARRKRPLEMYARVKDSLSFEPYLEGRYDRVKRLKLRLRLGVSGLAGDRGRLSEGSRECMLCDRDAIETAEHMISECSAYEELRDFWWHRVEARFPAQVDALREAAFAEVVLGKVRGREWGEEAKRALDTVSESFLWFCWAKRSARLAEGTAQVAPEFSVESDARVSPRPHHSHHPTPDWPSSQASVEPPGFPPMAES